MTVLQTESHVSVYLFKQFFPVDVKRLDSYSLYGLFFVCQMAFENKSYILIIKTIIKSFIIFSVLIASLLFPSSDEAEQEVKL